MSVRLSVHLCLTGVKGHRQLDDVISSASIHGYVAQMLQREPQQRLLSIPWQHKKVRQHGSTRYTRRRQSNGKWDEQTSPKATCDYVNMKQSVQPHERYI